MFYLTASRTKRFFVSYFIHCLSEYFARKEGKKESVVLAISTSAGQLHAKRGKWLSIVVTPGEFLLRTCNYMLYHVSFAVSHEFLLRIIK